MHADLIGHDNWDLTAEMAEMEAGKGLREVREAGKVEAEKAEQGKSQGRFYQCNFLLLE